MWDILLGAGIFAIGTLFGAGLTGINKHDKNDVK